MPTDRWYNDEPQYSTDAELRQEYTSHPIFGKQNTAAYRLVEYMLDRGVINPASFYGKSIEYWFINKGEHRWVYLGSLNARKLSYDHLRRVLDKTIIIAEEMNLKPVYGDSAIAHPTIRHLTEEIANEFVDKHYLPSLIGFLPREKSSINR